MNYKLKTILALSLCLTPLLNAQQVQAQTQQSVQNVINGTVVDDKGETVIGATVLVEGEKATQGTVTDLDGHFKINVPKGKKLRITYIGFEPVIVEAKDGMKVQLKGNETQLEGVEVVAYGVQKKVTVTGAISSVKGEDLTRTSVSNVTNVLAGQLTGVSTVQTSGEPGSDAATIYLRGQATWEDSSPLIQVDGVEREMNDIDPDEIESITVLKDASATAVFGVRGANGVILITTKRGNEGKPKINFSTSFTALTPNRPVEQTNSYEYATYYNQMNANDGTEPLFSDGIVEKFRDGSDPIRFPSTVWTDYVMKDVTLQQQHNVSISGGTKAVKYFISGSYYSQGGLYKEFNMPYDYGYDYKRYNYRANLDMEVSKTTTLSINVSGNRSVADKPYSGGNNSSQLIKQIYYATPFSSPGIIDGRYILTATDYDDLTLPYVGGTGLVYYGNGFRHNVTNKLSGDLELKQKLDFITKGLNWRIKGSYNSSYSANKTGSNDVAQYTPVLQEDGTMKYRKIGETTTPSYNLSTGKARNWYFETAFSWNRSFGLHSLSALALYNQSKTYYPSTYSDIPRGYVGLVGRVTYDYANKYMAEFNVGYNGSENFAPGKRFSTFPAASAGWTVSEEKFFQPLRKVVDYMKIRASWGLVGNDRIGGSRFMYTSDPYIVNSSSFMGRGGYAYSFGIDNATASRGAYLDAMNNPDVTWEKSFKQDYGVDVNFLDSRLRAVFDYYYEKRKDILLTPGTVPAINGFGSTLPYVNDGKVNSWGWEVSLKWNDKISKDFRYWAGVNLSFNDNEIKEMDEAPQENAYQYRKGHRIGSRKMYEFFELYNENTEARYRAKYGTDLPVQNVEKLEYGDAVYVDLNGDGKIDANDMGYGNGYTDDPRYTIGINLGFSWKRFSFNMQWTGAWDVTRMLDANFRYPFYSASDKTRGGLLKYIYDNTWTADNPDWSAEYPRASWENYDNNYATSTLYEKDAKYLRLKTLQLTYDFSFPWMKKIGMNKLQVALSGYNLLTFTPYLWGDPESRAGSAPTYPLQRTYTFSLKLGF